MKKTIETSIIIHASREKVWKELINFDSYPHWNPFITSLSGELKIGNQLKATIQGMKFAPEVLTVSEKKHFSWKGKLLFKGIFDGEHIFELEENTDGTTTFRQSENFSGILVGMFKKKIEVDTKSGFIKMNKALKKVTENL